MSESKQRWIALSKLLVACSFAFLYALGGENEKWIRRFLAPAILCLAMFGYSRDWRCLIQAPLMMISLSFGYGADVLWEKIWRRLLYGALNGASASSYMAYKKRWLVFGFNMVLITSACIVFGVWNPLPDARTEELVLGFIIGFLSIMSIK